MENIIRNVSDIEQNERQMLEHILGRQLREDQQVIIQVVTPGSEEAATTERSRTPAADQLPDWCNVYDGLTEEQRDDVESVILQRANLNRPST